MQDKLDYDSTNKKINRKVDDPEGRRPKPMLVRVL